MKKWTLLTAFLALVLMGGACDLADKPGGVRVAGPTPGLLYEAGEFWQGLTGWTYSAPVEIWPDRLHNVDSFCVIRRGGWIRHAGPTYRVLHADTISLAGNRCYLTNFSWWTGTRMNFTLKLMNDYGSVLFQTTGVVIGDYYTQINVHDFTAPLGVTNYELTYYTEQDSAMVDGCILRQYPDQNPPPPPPPPPSPDTVWTLESVRLAKNQRVRYYNVRTYAHTSLTLDADVLGDVIGYLSWSNGTVSNFSAKNTHLSQTFAVPSGATYLAVTLVGKGKSGATVSNAALHN